MTQELRNSLREEFVRRENHKFDVFHKSRNIGFEPTTQKGVQALSVEIPDIETRLNFTDWSYHQYCRKIRVPGGFLHRNPAYLQKQIFDYWKERDDIFLFRCSNRPSPYIRAVLSSKYARVDDIVVLRQIDTILPEEKIELFNMNESDRMITFLLGMLDLPINIISLGGNSYEWFLGLVVSNSEVGYATLKIDWVLLRKHQTDNTNEISSSYINITRILENMYKRRHVGELSNIIKHFTSELEYRENLISEFKNKGEVYENIEKIIEDASNNVVSERNIREIERELGKKERDDIFKELGNSPSKLNLAVYLSDRGEETNTHLQYLYSYLAGKILENR